MCVFLFARSCVTCVECVSRGGVQPAALSQTVAQASSTDRCRSAPAVPALPARQRRARSLPCCPWPTNIRGRSESARSHTQTACPSISLATASRCFAHDGAPSGMLFNKQKGQEFIFFIVVLLLLPDPVAHVRRAMRQRPRWPAHSTRRPRPRASGARLTDRASRSRQRLN